MTIMPGFIIGLFGIVLFVMPYTWGLLSALEGMGFWLLVLVFASGYSMYKQGRKWRLIVYSPLSILIVFLVFACWVLWGLPALAAGSRQRWIKVKRY